MADMLPANTLSPELTARVEQLATEGFADWAANATAEQKAAGVAQHEKFMSDPEYGQQEMAKVPVMWGEADANADGLLDEAEYIVFAQKQRDHSASTGNYATEMPGFDSRMWALCNESNPATPAVAMSEYMVVIGVVMVKWEALRQASA